MKEDFEYRPGFLAPEDADRLLECLWRELDWQRYVIRVFGRSVRQPRLTAWCADPGVSYSYSGLKLSSSPWHPSLRVLRRRLEQSLGAAFNSVLANAYRDGGESMGWHADDEPELGEFPCIASVSLGAERWMLVRPKIGGPSRRLDLEHGSLLVMQGRSQADWMHSVPRTRKPLGLRINLTFRRVLVAESG